MKVGIVRCQSMSDGCGSNHCLEAIREKSGEFEKYDTVELVGIQNCGGCGFNTANKIVPKAMSLKRSGAEVIHMGVCMMHFCPFKDIYEKGITKKTGLPVVRGTHPHEPPWEIGGVKVEYSPSWHVDWAKVMSERASTQDSH